MGGINLINVPRGPNKKPFRAKWKSPSQIEALRREGKSFRCERKGCSTKICKVLPAKKPKDQNPNINSIDLPKIVGGLCEEDDDEVGISEN